ncbi:kunitz-type serine protease inhibitor homolog calcicludine-like [Anticarsia gemmatalis]|uniref:kunitz-type serine protease inhibitor homolog calcicludine-like n=1 Tax=Anticarsia gemmatalis TaxID=129554 RepID=UPI003F76E01C
MKTCISILLILATIIVYTEAIPNRIPWRCRASKIVGACMPAGEGFKYDLLTSQCIVHNFQECENTSNRFNTIEMCQLICIYNRSNTYGK